MIPQTTNPTTSNPIFDIGSLTNTQPINTNPTMKQLFKNNEITILVSTNGVFDGNSTTNFYISNNISKQLTNVKVNFMVSKHLLFKVLSTSSNILEPLQTLGVKKVIIINSRRYV
jgi:hypothetical protein